MPSLAVFYGDRRMLCPWRGDHLLSYCILCDYGNWDDVDEFQKEIVFNLMNAACCQMTAGRFYFIFFYIGFNL